MYEICHVKISTRKIIDNNNQHLRRQQYNNAMHCCVLPVSTNHADFIFRALVPMLALLF